MERRRVCTDSIHPRCWNTSPASLCKARSLWSCRDDSPAGASPRDRTMTTHCRASLAPANRNDQQVCQTDHLRYVHHPVCPQKLMVKVATGLRRMRRHHCCRTRGAASCRTRAAVRPSRWSNRRAKWTRAGGPKDEPLRVASGDRSGTGCGRLLAVS